MQQQVQRPVQRTAIRRVNDDKHDLRPASARQFMKLPLSGLLTAGERLTFTRLTTPPDQAA